MIVEINITQDFKLNAGEKFFLGKSFSLFNKHLIADLSFEIPIGSFIILNNNTLAQIEEGFWISTDSLKREKVYLVKADQPFFLEKGTYQFLIEKKGYSLSVITLSDKGSEGKRTDKSGPLISSLIKDSVTISFENYFLIPDNKDILRSLLTRLCLEDGIDIVITTGGTGVTSRDITADVTKKLIEKRLIGFEFAMLNEGLKKTPHAIISRAVCGILKKSLIINLPGSPKAVEENLSAILPALSHTLEKLNDSPIECGQGSSS